jgi:hypothetical protein
MATAKYTWTDYKRNDDILKELKTELLLDKILKYNSNWIQHDAKKQASKLYQTYKPQGLRKQGRHLET